jgi:hypothetical protein
MNEIKSRFKNLKGKFKFLIAIFLSRGFQSYKTCLYIHDLQLYPFLAAKML